MGSTGSRPRLRKVTPCKSLQEDRERLQPQWTLPALPVSMEQSSGSQGHKKTTLPPLKQEITLSTLSEPCSAGSYPQKQNNNSSIIHSHPPRRHQALQPPALQIGHTRTQISMTRDGRGGGVQLFSTTGKTGHTCTSRMTQGGFLEAQAALSQHTHQQQQAHCQHGRELRRHKVIYTVNGGQSTSGVQRLKLVRRPTETNIFLDESVGWMWSEPDKGGQRIKGARGICDLNLDQNRPQI